MLAPSGNRVYAGNASPLAAAELAITAGLAAVEETTLAGVAALRFDAEPEPELLAVIAGQSAALALFESRGDLVRPIALPELDLLDEDLVTIPKYQGKTNEQFTRLLLNVTLASVRRQGGRPLTVLDPMCGRGTTLTTAWTLGCDAAGVEGDEKAVEAMAAFLKTWLRRKRLKHTADMSPVRRDGKSLGKRFDAELKLPERTLAMTVFTGDTRTSAALFGKRRFDAIVADAPYGVVHGSQTDVRGHAGKRDRSPAGLLAEAIPVWVSQLAPGGALGLSWNTYGLAREELVGLLTRAGLAVHDEGPWRQFAHRVDSAINRDLAVGVLERA